jgi:hypothetical protein
MEKQERAARWWARAAILTTALFAPPLHAQAGDAAKDRLPSVCFPATGE